MHAGGNCRRLLPLKARRSRDNYSAARALLLERGTACAAARLLRIRFAGEARFGRIDWPRPFWAPAGIRPDAQSLRRRDLRLSNHAGTG
jgi:hypothetical protein